MVFKGLKFGLLLQFAVGPICLMVFNLSASAGFLKSIIFIISVVLVDALYILLSVAGIAIVIDKKNVKLIVKIFGSIILFIFGLNVIFSSIDIKLIPEIFILSNYKGNSVFLQGIVLTASNPLTIIFWSGVFSTQIINNNYKKEQLLQFAIGCILATLLFLSLVAVLGTFLRTFFSREVIMSLNVLIGFILMFFGIKLMLKKI